jgi:hypothetical protein
MDALPRAAVRERERLVGAVERGGLESRILRCPGVHSGGYRRGAIVATPMGIFASLSHGDRIGTIVTAIEKLPRGRVRVEADFRESSNADVAECFDASIPEIADVPEDASEEEIEAWWEEHHNGLRDPAGSLTAIVHQAAFKYLWTPDLLDRLDEEAQAEAKESEARREARRRELAERYAGSRMARAAEAITREAARPETPAPVVLVVADANVAVSIAAASAPTTIALNGLTSRIIRCVTDGRKMGPCSLAPPSKATNGSQPGPELPSSHGTEST